MRIVDTKNVGRLRADYRPNICGGTETRAGLRRTWHYGRTCTPAAPHNARSLPRKCASRAERPLLNDAHHSANTSWSGSSVGGSLPRHRAMVSASSWAAASRMVSVGAVIPTRAQPGAASKAVATRVGSMIMVDENIYGTLNQGRARVHCPPTRAEKTIDRLRTCELQMTWIISPSRRDGRALRWWTMAITADSKSKCGLARLD